MATQTQNQLPALVSENVLVLLDSAQVCCKQYAHMLGDLRQGMTSCRMQPKLPEMCVLLLYCFSLPVLASTTIFVP